ncbi:MAG: IMPACT family protein [Synergistaceae bacterium]|jgi:uncharacterized YigZ family protein|nr:IMPACT family protein [Synergistaceae bacterium]
MNLLDGQYLTIQNPIDVSVTIQRSRFIASLRTVQNREEFNVAMSEIINLYPKATHYCWAYRFYDNPPSEHSSDAGEPSGTAGRPILGTLKKYSLLNAMAVVARYYGGIKLGVKGLISAYGGTTLQAVESANIVLAEPMRYISFSCSYEHYNLLLSRMAKNAIESTEIKAEFTDVISGEIVVPLSKIDAVSNELKNLRAANSAFVFSVR